MTNAQDLSNLTFEQALAELETIVARLERGDVPLAESVAAYERGEALKSHCTALLRAAEMRVEKIRLNTAGEAEGTTPFEG